MESAAGPAALPAKLVDRASALPFSVTVRTGNGIVARLGDGPEVGSVHVASQDGMRALRSMSELTISEAYVRGDIDFAGDLIQAMRLRDLISDNHPWIRLWARLQPILIGRVRCNASWVAKHYDAGNVQLLAADSVYNTYTPGIYDHDDDSLEVGAQRKFDSAFDSIRLSPGARVLDVGCGWGGFLRYCACRGVDATGITLSGHQFDYVSGRIAQGGAIRGRQEVLFQDFFSYQPASRFNGITMMGVMEDLSDYGPVMARVTRWLEPGGRIYCDFASADKRFSTSAFVTKHIWPGTFRMVYMPQFLEALSKSCFDIVELHNDRHNYYLWTKGLHERWLERRAEVVEAAGEATWRLFRLLFASVASIMSPSSERATAYRLVLESRRAPVER